MKLQHSLRGVTLLFSFGIVCQAQSISATYTSPAGSCTSTDGLSPAAAVSCGSNSNAITAGASCGVRLENGETAYASTSGTFGMLSGTANQPPDVSCSAVLTAQSSFSDTFTFEPIGDPANAVIVFTLFTDIGFSGNGFLAGSIAGMMFQGSNDPFFMVQGYTFPLQSEMPIAINASGSVGLDNGFSGDSFDFALHQVIVCRSGDASCYSGEPARALHYKVYTASGFNYPGTFVNADYVGAAPEAVGPSPLKLSNTSWHFSHHALGQTSGDGKIYIYNEGPGADMTTGFTLTGTDAADFQISATTCAPRLSAYHTCSVTFNFTPSAIAARSAMLNLNDNSTNGPVQIPIAGDGIPD